MPLPRQFNPELGERILQMIREGTTLKDAAKLAGVSVATITYEIRVSRDFDQKYKAAKAIGFAIRYGKQSALRRLDNEEKRKLTRKTKNRSSSNLTAATRKGIKDRIQPKFDLDSLLQDEIPDQQQDEPSLRTLQMFDSLLDAQQDTTTVTAALAEDRKNITRIDKPATLLVLPDQSTADLILTFKPDAEQLKEVRRVLKPGGVWSVEKEKTAQQ